MKLLLSALVASAALTCAASANYVGPITTCTDITVPAYEANDYVGASQAGQYIDAIGHRWIGFNADGSVATSTVATKTTTSCTTVDPT